MKVIVYAGRAQGVGWADETGARDRRGGPPAAPAERPRRLPVRPSAMIDAAVELVTRRVVRPRNVYFDAFVPTG